jgi:predicted transcriptional regulator
MYRASLSFAQINRYVSFLVEINLLEKIEMEEKTVYKTTQKGASFLKRHKEIKELLKNLS